jgi:hypothetical protein
VHSSRTESSPFQPYLPPLFPFLPTLLTGIILPKLQAHTINTVSLIRRRRVPLALEHMSQMPSTIRANNLRPLHAESSVCVSGHSAWYGVEESRPAAARLEFVVRFVQRSGAADAGVDAGGGGVFVVFACEGRFGTFFAEDAKLLYMTVNLCITAILLATATVISSFPRSLFALPSPPQSATSLDEEYRYIPLFKTACHSPSLFCTGCAIFLLSAVLNSAPKKGIVGIEDLSATLGRTAALNGSCWARVAW